ncbi:hypothetical protein G6F46_015575 [Rhizopus delemar]|nr:hypothetical protein G6F46_015575 [Rhizopus delemar]
MKVSGEVRSRTGASTASVAAWRVKATPLSRSSTSSRNRSASAERMAASLRISAGPSLAWRSWSMLGPISSWHSARRASSGRRPVSPR